MLARLSTLVALRKRNKNYGAPPPPLSRFFGTCATLDAGGAPKKKCRSPPPPPPPRSSISFFWTCATFEAGGGPEKRQCCAPPPPPLLKILDPPLARWCVQLVCFIRQASARCETPFNSARCLTQDLGIVKKNKKRIFPHQNQMYILFCKCTGVRTSLRELQSRTFDRETKCMQPRGGGGGGLRFRSDGGCAAEAAKPVPIFKGHFGGKEYPLLCVFFQENDVFVYFSDEMGENI